VSTAAPSPPTPPQRHAFVLLPQFPLLGLAGAREALAAANEVLEQPAYASLVITPDGQPARAACGTRVAADASLAAMGTAFPLDAVFVVAGGPYPEPVRDGHAPLHAWLRQRAAAGCVLGGIGTGSAVLAQAGLLARHRATLPWALVSQMGEAHPDIVVTSHLHEIDGARLSCTTGTASLDLVLAWLAQRHGERVLQGLLAQLGLERLRPAGERQRAPVAGRVGGAGALTNAKLAEAVALMEANLGEPLATEDIAQLVGVSRRQLERLFKQHLDELPSRYYAELRLARARRLLQQTSQSILQIGLACGFANGSHFSNAYRARFGRTPRDERSPRAVAWEAMSHGLHEAPAPAPPSATPADVSPQEPLP
jgi:transcriptional regulator GlxA family with amidase domain